MKKRITIEEIYRQLNENLRKISPEELRRQVLESVRRSNLVKNRFLGKIQGSNRF